VTSFSAGWLALREPADRAARAALVANGVAGILAPHPMPVVVDLGAGTGANLRFMAPRLPRGQRWRLIDRDLELLALARHRIDGVPGASVSTICADLAPLDPHLLKDATLVTASALLDLVSDAWLTNLVSQCCAQGAAGLFALSYDGRITCSPADDDDAAIRDLVNAHQRTDKGFGRALGPEAAGRAAALFEAKGYHVVRARSDWRLGEEEADLQRALIEGWARAAAELRPDLALAAAAWRERRLALVAAERSRIVVGHEDVGAWKELRTR
jgi:SAM-dependent methyltransferase